MELLSLVRQSLCAVSRSEDACLIQKLTAEAPTMFFLGQSES